MLHLFIMFRTCWTKQRVLCDILVGPPCLHLEFGLLVPHPCTCVYFSGCGAPVWGYSVLSHHLFDTRYLYVTGLVEDVWVHLCFRLSGILEILLGGGKGSPPCWSQDKKQTEVRTRNTTSAHIYLAAGANTHPNVGINLSFQ